MECERVQIRTFFCRPRENEAAIGVTATAMTHFSDGSTRPYPDGWPRSLEASVTLYFAGDADFIISATSPPTLSLRRRVSLQALEPLYSGLQVFPRLRLAFQQVPLGLLR